MRQSYNVDQALEIQLKSRGHENSYPVNKILAVNESLVHIECHLYMMKKIFVC